MLWVLVNVIYKDRMSRKGKGSENPSPQHFYHQLAFPRVKNSGQIRICVSLVMPLMAGKELEGGYTGFSARQSQCKMSKVEIQTRSFMASTLRPSPTHQMLKRLSQQSLK